MKPSNQPADPAVDPDDDPADDPIAGLLGVRLAAPAVRAALRAADGLLFQRLEFLGDAVLDAVVSPRLVQAGVADVGEASLAKVAMVSDVALSRAARHHGLVHLPHRLVGDKRLADLVEASIAAVWLEHGWAPAVALIDRIVGLPPVRDRLWVGARPGPSLATALTRLGVPLPPDHALVRAAATPGAERRLLAFAGDGGCELAAAWWAYRQSGGDPETLTNRRGRRYTVPALAAAARRLGLGSLGRGVPSQADLGQAVVGITTLAAGWAEGLRVAAVVLDLDRPEQRQRGASRTAFR